MDFALDGPIPWKVEKCLRAGTVHLGGTLEEIVAGEAAVWRGEHPERPFVLLAEQSLFDPTRAPEGKHTVGAYCHVPNGSEVDMIGTIEAQIERFVPGFSDHILAKSAMDCTDLERTNANLVGGGITGGAMDLRQLLARPALRISPYSTPAKVSTSARLRRRPAVGYTACVATSPPTRPALPELGSTGASRSSGAVVREKRVRTF